MRLSILIFTTLLATPAFAESCFSKASATAEVQWCQSYEADIVQAKIKQLVHKLKAKHAEKKDFAAQLDKAEAAWSNAVSQQCSLIEAIDTSTTGASDCMTRIERNHAAYLTELLHCDGYNYGVTSNEMLDCATDAKATLEGELRFYINKTSPAFGGAEDWKERKRFLKVIEDEK